MRRREVEKKCPAVDFFGVAQSPKLSGSGTKEIYLVRRCKQVEYRKKLESFAARQIGRPWRFPGRTCEKIVAFPCRIFPTIPDNCLHEPGFPPFRAPLISRGEEGPDAPKNGGL